MTTTRRKFLATSTAAAVAAALPAAARSPDCRLPGKKILVLGGTGFVGPHFVRAALAAGHQLTLFNRGKTNPGLFPEVEQLRGQRRRPRPEQAAAQAQDLNALLGRKWDCVLDTSAYFTGEVEDVCAVLQGNVQQYLFISSLSVYPALGNTADPIDESSVLAECADKYTLELGKEMQNYGGLKRHCEDAVRAAFPDGATLVRPGYIVGPGDPTDRFSYWPARFDRGGECLAPGDPNNDLQFIDARDLADWLVKLCEQRAVGAFNAVGFDGSISVGEFLHTGKGTRNHSCRYTWVDDAFLESNEVSSWGEMGCWTPSRQNGHTSNARAIATGATYRPIAQTIADTADWVKNARGNRPWRAGMTAEREQALLAKWRQH